MTNHIELRRCILIGSVWHWDLWAAIVVSTIVVVIWVLTDPKPRWEWIAPIIVASITMTGMSWNRWETLRSRLQGSPYGELVRVPDDNEDEVMMPYYLTVFIALISALCALITAIFIESVSTIWVSLLVFLTSLFTTWMIFAIVALIRLTRVHYRNMAQVESMREKVEASQRHHEAEKRRQTTAQDTRQTGQEP